MKNKFSELTKDWPEERKERVAAKVGELEGQMALDELRQALDLSQAELAKRLNLEQPESPRSERSENISTGHLRAIVEAMGGQLDLTAQFSDLTVRIELRP